MSDTDVVPTMCEDWSLNEDADSSKKFWWNKTYSISVWDSCLALDKPVAETEDSDVWRGFILFQVDTVYKLCTVCKGPEANVDMKVCCYCGQTVHPACSNESTVEQTAWKPANKGLEEHLRVCFNCDDVKTEETEPEKHIDGVRRAARRALTLRKEITAEVASKLGDFAENSSASMVEVQTAVQSHFQSDESLTMLERRPIDSKGGGFGVVATKKIPRFTVVGVYPGYEDPLSGEHAKMGRPQPRYSLVDLNCADYWNDVFVEFGKCFTPFINEPLPTEKSNVAWIQETVRPTGRLSVMTVRDIEAGEELLIGYGPLYPRDYPFSYDAYAYHIHESSDTAPCFALWHWTSAEEKDANFVCYCGYESDTGRYAYWKTEDEMGSKGDQS